MSDMTPPTTDMQLLYVHGLMALFGAVVHASNAHRTGQSKTWIDFLLLTIMSSFSGILFALLALNFFDNPYMTLAITGAGGYAGVEGITWLLDVFKTALANKIANK